MNIDTAATPSVCVGSHHPVSVGSHHTDAPPVSVGSHHPEATEATMEKCREVLEKAGAGATWSQSREHIEALQAMLPDMHKQPSKSRIRELATHLGVSQKKHGKNLQTHQLFANVQDVFLRVC